MRKHKVKNKYITHILHKGLLEDYNQYLLILRILQIGIFDVLAQMIIETEISCDLEDLEVIFCVSYFEGVLSVFQTKWRASSGFALDWA